MFSFFSNKNISTAEGGMLVTDNEDYYNEACLLKSHGMTTMSYQRASGHSTDYDVVRLGYNYRMDDIRAAIGLVQLDKLRSDLEKRAQVREWYIKYLKDNSKFIIPFLTHKGFVSNYIFPIILKNANKEERDYLRIKLDSVGIQTSIHYPPVHKFSIYLNKQNLINTETASNSLISLPMYSKLVLNDIKNICNCLI